MFSKIKARYSGDNPNKIIDGYCHKCKTVHSLPAKDWIIELRGKKIKLICAQKIEVSSFKQ